jgi:hypothetical protein
MKYWKINTTRREYAILSNCTSTVVAHKNNTNKEYAKNKTNNRNTKTSMMVSSVQMISVFIVAVNIILPSSPGHQQYGVDAFVPTTCHQRPRSAITTSTFGRKRKISSSIWYADYPEYFLSEMKESDMEKELEESYYGISTEESIFDDKKELLLEMALNDARQQRLNGLREKRQERVATATSVCSNISYLVFCYFILTNILVPGDGPAYDSLLYYDKLE